MKNLSSKGVDFIVDVETSGNIKKYCKAYPDSGGVWTIGIGSTVYENGQKVKQGDEITVERAKQLFNNMIKGYVNKVNQVVKVPLNQNQFDALVSFCYNVGQNGFATSTLLKKINAKASDAEIKEQFLRWKFVKSKLIQGLVNRRKKEVDFYFSASTVTKISTLVIILCGVIAYSLLPR